LSDFSRLKYKPSPSSYGAFSYLLKWLPKFTGLRGSQMIAALFKKYRNCDAELRIMHHVSLNIAIATTINIPQNAKAANIRLAVGIIFYEEPSTDGHISESAASLARWSLSRYS
jgi:hypothetical protein